MSLWHSVFTNPEEKPLEIGRRVIEHSLPCPPAWFSEASIGRSCRERHVYSYPAGEVSFAVVVEKREDEDGYEAIDLYPWVRSPMLRDFEILDFLPDEDDCTGRLSLVSQKGYELTIIDPLFCYTSISAEPGRKFKFSLGGLAYAIEHVTEPQFEITEGPALESERQRRLAEDPRLDPSSITSVTFSMAQLRTLMPVGEKGEHEFQTELESVEEIQVDELRFFKVVGIVERELDPPLHLPIFVSSEIAAGYVPKVGDLVRGVLALQGHAVRQIECEEKWADSVTQDSNENRMDAFLRAMAAEDYLSDLHPGAAAVAKAVIAAGWDVTKYKNDSNSPDIPCFRAERGDRSLNVWVRAWMQGTEAPAGFTEEEVVSLRDESIEHGGEAAFVTVQCREAGEYYQFTYDGTDGLESIVGPLMKIESQKKGGFALEAHDEPNSSS